MSPRGLLDRDFYELEESTAPRCETTDMHGKRRCVWIAGHTSGCWMGTDRAYQLNRPALLSVLPPPEPRKEREQRRIRANQ